MRAQRASSYEVDRAPIEGEWRCGRCRSGEFVTAVASVHISGPLQPDGEVEDATGGDQVELFEGSIQCDREFPDQQLCPWPTLLERWLDGMWKRWVDCDGANCEFGKLVRRGYISGEPTCPACKGTGGAWEPSYGMAEHA